MTDALAETFSPTRRSLTVPYWHDNYLIYRAWLKNEDPTSLARELLQEAIENKRGETEQMLAECAAAESIDLEALKTEILKAKKRRRGGEDDADD